MNWERPKEASERIAASKAAVDEDWSSSVFFAVGVGVEVRRAGLALLGGFVVALLLVSISKRNSLRIAKMKLKEENCEIAGVEITKPTKYHNNFVDARCWANFSNSPRIDFAD